MNVNAECNMVDESGWPENEKYEKWLYISASRNGYD
jgi:hypothetical protein